MTSTEHDFDLLQEKANNITKDFNALKSNLDVVYLFISGDTVLLLQAGFAFLECGVVRTKNTTNILLVTLCDLYMSGIAYFLLGWGFSRGKGNGFIGWTQFALMGVPDSMLCDWYFRCIVAALVATIMSGAVSERCNFMAHAVYSCAVSGFIYPVVEHWAWNQDGWLNCGKDQYKYVDFAGSGVVHICSGVCSFVASYVIGPRIGRFDSATGEAKEIKGHSVPMTALGGFFLIFGFVSFNAGAQRHISHWNDGEAVALAVSNTMIAGSFGCLTSLILYKSGVLGNPKQWSFLPSLNGTITAMVTTCAAGDHFPQWGAALIGVVASIVYFAMRRLVLRLKVDDPLDATAVHFGGGALGIITATLFARRNSLLHSYLPESGYWVLWNLAGLVAITAWSAITTLLLFGAMKKMNILRVSPMVELRGLDLNKHGEPAYPAEGWEEEQYNESFEEEPELEPKTEGRTIGQAPALVKNLRRSRNGILPVMSGSFTRREPNVDNLGSLKTYPIVLMTPTFKENPLHHLDSPRI